MNRSTVCPDDRTLALFKANRLPPGELVRLKEHLDGCASCRAAAESAVRDVTRDSRDDGTLSVPGSSIHARLDPPQRPGEIGRLGIYRLTGVLGEGGMAVVYDAVESGLERAVALKVLKGELRDDGSRERFYREARTLASLRSERVVQVFAVGETNGMPYLAMEKLQGETLADRLKRDRWLPVAEALSVAREVAEGLADLHANGLIHRDVKPDNLWLETDRDGRVVRVKLIDFGIARHVGGDPTLTTPGLVVGTPVYMAPEQAAGRTVDERADLYALGCVLYRSLSGRTPFDDAPPDPLAVIRAVLAGDSKPIREILPTLSPSVVELIERLMEHEPEKRMGPSDRPAARLRELEHEERAGTSKTQIIAAGSHAARRGARKAQPWSIAVGAAIVLSAVLFGASALVYRLRPDLFAGGAPPLAAPPTPPAAAAPTPAAGAPIPIGVLFSQTDSAAVHELPLIDAVRMAVEEINQSGGVLGRPIEAKIADGASDERTFARQAARLIDDERVAAIFGCGRSAYRRAVEAVCEVPSRDVLLFCPADDEGLDESEHVVRLGGAPNQTVAPLVKYLYADLRKRRMFLLGEDSTYSRAVEEIAAHEFEQLAGVVAGRACLPRGETDLKPTIDQILASNADVVVCSSTGADIATIFRAFRRARIAPPEVPVAWLALSEADLPHFPTTLSGDFAAGGSFPSRDALPPAGAAGEPAESDFSRRWKLRYGAGRSVDPTTEAAYLAVHLWKRAVEKADSLRTWDVRVALRGPPLETPLGPLKIDPLSLHAWRAGRVAKIVVDDEGRPKFEVVHRTPGPIEPVVFPLWKSRKEWLEFIGGLKAEWGGWERRP